MKITLSKSRSNPIKNKRTTTLYELGKYKDDEDIFISFTELQKLGINPSTKYSTPIGIYSYPLKEVWEQYIQDGGISAVPFAADKPYISIFKPKNKDRILNLDSFNIGEELSKMIKMFGMSPRLIKAIQKGESTARDKTDSSRFWNITRLFVDGNIASWTKLFVNLGWEGVIDYGNGVIHPNEPVQAVFFNKSFVTQIDLIENKSSPFVITDLHNANPMEYESEKNIETSYSIAIKLKFDSSKIPRGVINSIAKDPEYSYMFAVRLHFNLTKIPQEIINSISKNLRYSYNFAQGVEFNLTKIPQEMISRITEDFHYSYNFAEGVQFDLTRIPQEIIESIAESVEYSYSFAEGVKFDSTRIPQEIIHGITKDPECSYMFVTRINFDLSKSPKEIINSIEQDSRYSYSFAEAVEFDSTRISQEMINAISQNSGYSYSFAQGVEFNLTKIPQEIINGIAKNPDHLSKFKQKTQTNQITSSSRLFASYFNDNYIGKLSYK